MNNDFIFALEKTKGIGITTINKINKTVFNEKFPNKLKCIEKVPFSLHLSDDELLKNKSVAIAASRKSSKYGDEVAFKIAKFLLNKGYTVVSGIDTSHI